MTRPADHQVAETTAENIREQLRARYAAGECVVGVELAGKALNEGRAASYKLAAQGALADGVIVISVGRKYQVPLLPLMSALGLCGDDEKAQP